MEPGHRWGLACVVVALAGMAIEPWATRPESQLVFLSVGQGDATLLMSRGQTAMIDAGPASEDFNSGSRLIVPELRRRGVRQIDLCFITHPDQDHIGGLSAIAEKIPVRKVVLRREFEYHPLWLNQVHKIRRLGTKVEYLPSGQTFSTGDGRWEVGWPLLSQAPRDDNDLSMVLRLELGGSTALFTGDLRAEGEADLVKSGAARTTLFKAGHHGSTTSSTSLLLEALRPEVVVASAGRNNRYGHPHPDTIARINAVGAKFFRTDRAGSLTFVPDGKGSWQAIRQRAFVFRRSW